MAAKADAKYPPPITFELTCADLANPAPICTMPSCVFLTCYADAGAPREHDKVAAGSMQDEGGSGTLCRCRPRYPASLLSRLCPR